MHAARYMECYPNDTQIQSHIFLGTAVLTATSKQETKNQRFLWHTIKFVQEKDW